MTVVQSMERALGYQAGHWNYCIWVIVCNLIMLIRIFQCVRGIMVTALLMVTTKKADKEIYTLSVPESYISYKCDVKITNVLNIRRI